MIGMFSGLLLLLVQLLLVPVIIIGGIYHLLKRRSVSSHELDNLRNELRAIKTDIEEIKEQIAEFVIKTY